MPTRVQYAFVLSISVLSLLITRCFIRRGTAPVRKFAHTCSVWLRESERERERWSVLFTVLGTEGKSFLLYDDGVRVYKFSDFWHNRRGKKSRKQRSWDRSIGGAWFMAYLSSMLGKVFWNYTRVECNKVELFCISGLKSGILER